MKFNYEEQSGFVSATITIVVDTQEELDAVKAFQVSIEPTKDSLGNPLKKGDEVYIGDMSASEAIDSGDVRTFDHIRDTTDYFVMSNGVGWYYCVKVEALKDSSGVTVKVGDVVHGSSCDIDCCLGYIRKGYAPEEFLGMDGDRYKVKDKEGRVTSYAYLVRV